MKWITAGDITIWAQSHQRECAGLLPELIRRLILTSTPQPREMSFPSDDSIVLAGWDGRLDTDSTSWFVPDGASGWELSVQDRIKQKADDDYSKRTKDPLGLIATDSTFVFVTPQSWSGATTWVNDKRSEGAWKDVRAVSADDLELWLDSAPGVARWLATKIGKVVSGDVLDLESYWDEWSLSTNPPLSPDIVIGGRSNEVDQVHQWIRGVPAELVVQGDSPDEANAFLYAAIARLPQLELTKALARSIIVSTPAQFRECAQAFTGLIVIASTDSAAVTGCAVARGHHVYVCADARIITRNGLIRLPRPRRKDLEDSLHRSGLLQTDASRLARDFGRSLPALRRSMSTSNALREPDWIKPGTLPITLALLLAVEWDDQKDGDRKILESLSDTTFDAIQTQLTFLLRQPDTPIHRIGTHWALKSPVDAWFLLAPYLSSEVTKRFHDAALEVLRETHPKYDLPADERWAAAVHGKISQFSGSLRNGFGQSLALLSVFANRATLLQSPDGIAANIVRHVLESAQSAESWATLSDVLPLLAEAAPETFIAGVEERLSRDNSLFVTLLQDDGSVFGECRHSGLLWALESLAWSPEYFARAVSVLTDLARIDPPGGRWSNRPINSLKDLFLPSYPQTHAKPSERLTALSRLREQSPTIAWEVVRAHFDRGFFSESYHFRWRSTGDDRPGLEREPPDAITEFLVGLQPLASELACQEGNIISAANEFIRLPVEIRERLLSALETGDPSRYADSTRLQLLNELREAASWITSFADNDLKNLQPRLLSILERYAPTELLARHAWLLGQSATRLPDFDTKDFNAYDDEVAARRKRAARELLDHVSLAHIFDFASKQDYPGILPYSMAVAIRDTPEDTAIVDAIVQMQPLNPILVSAYAAGRVRAVGPEWVEREIQRLKSQNHYSSELCALLHMGLHEGVAAWKAVESHGTEVERVYWQRATGRSRIGEEADAEYAVAKLVQHDRVAAALPLAGDPKADFSTEILVRLLQSAVSIDFGSLAGNERTMFPFYIGHIIQHLHDKKELPIQQLAFLEWPYGALIDDLYQFKYVSSPLAIHQLLQQNPGFFSQLVGLYYKPDLTTDEEDTKPPSKEDIAKGRNAREVLGSWKLLPGLTADGNIDPVVFTSWIDDARRICDQSGHVTGCDLQIAELLSKAPAGTDGLWPHETVRELIEKLRNRVIEQHISVGVYNARGATSRGLTEGGRSEHELSSKYRDAATKLRQHWPRTSAMLVSLADSYEHDATRIDLDAEVNDFEWN